MDEFELASELGQGNRGDDDQMGAMMMPSTAVAGSAGLRIWCRREAGARTQGFG